MSSYASQSTDAEEATPDSQTEGKFNEFSTELDRLCLVACMADSRFRTDTHSFQEGITNAVKSAFNRPEAQDISFTGGSHDGGCLVPPPHY